MKFSERYNYSETNVNLNRGLINDKLKAHHFENYSETRKSAFGFAGINNESVLDSFDRERHKRSLLQYESTSEVKEGLAKTSLVRAKEFGFEMETLLKEI